MTAYVHRLATVVPPARLDQERVRDAMEAWLGGGRRTTRLLHRIFGHSGIDTRHSVVDDLLDEGRARLFRDPDTGALCDPGTARRNEVYARASAELFPSVAQRALRGSPFRPEQVTHVITVSCTGFTAPGPDLAVVRGLGLPPSTERYHLGFMGCYAAFPALRMARAFCRAEPDAVVLVVALELCSLHLQRSREPDALIAASLFADGGAAAVVSAREPEGPALALESFAGTVDEEGAADMAWTLGDHGFDMILSSYVPELVGRGVRAAVEPVLRGAGIDVEEVDRWAVHPGGRAILDSVERGLCLPPEALAVSRGVLARYGNMSSATVLFVLERMLAGGLTPGESVVAMAFGPGLTVETGLFRAA